MGRLKTKIQQVGKKILGLSRDEPPTKKVSLDADHLCPCCDKFDHTYTFKTKQPPPEKVTALFSCPRTGNMFQAELQITNDEAATFTTPDKKSLCPASLMDQAIYDASKTIQGESPATARNFASSMITTSTGGVALYFTILKYFIGDKIPTNFGFAALSATPAFLFLIASIIFLFAFISRQSYVSLDIPQQFGDEMDRLIRKREAWNRVGLTFFVLGTASTFAALFIAFYLPTAWYTPVPVPAH
jgi:hypothetical protein